VAFVLAPDLAVWVFGWIGKDDRMWIGNWGSVSSIQSGSAGEVFWCDRAGLESFLTPFF
jgi:hypothetical protein